MNKELSLRRRPWSLYNYVYASCDFKLGKLRIVLLIIVKGGKVIELLYAVYVHISYRSLNACKWDYTIQRDRYY